jgi:SPP1 family predicted phage head-tail adaptor
VYYSLPTTNTDGQKVEVAAKLYSPWAEVLPLSGREQFQAQQAQAQLTHRVRMWSDSYSRQITPRHWLIRADGTTRLNITRVSDQTGRRKELDLDCVEQVTGM